MKQRETYVKSTLTEVARKAGFSKATVSRVLNGVGSASDGTRERIFHVAQELNYCPDVATQKLKAIEASKRAKRGSVAIVFEGNDNNSFVSDPYFGRFYSGIEPILSKAKLTPMLLRLEKGESDAECLEKLFQITAKVDGFIVIGKINSSVVEMATQQKPTVILNAHYGHYGVPFIFPDEVSGIQKALDYLEELGHSHILFFDIADCNPPNANHQARGKAFSDYALTHPNARSVVLSGRTKSMDDTAYDLLCEWQKKGEMPTALVCAADTLAAGFLEGAHRLGISVPDQLSVMGADDDALAQFVRPKLTTIRQPLCRMGARAVKILLEAIEDGESQESMTLLFDVELIHRSSCSKAMINVQ